MAKTNPKNTGKKPPVEVPKSKKLTQEELNKKYESAKSRASSGDINRIELEKGENIVRLVDANFEENFVSFVSDTEGNTRKINMGIDIKENKEKYSILFETVPDAKMQHRYYFRAITGKVVKTDKGKKTVLDNEIKLFEVGPTVFKQIAAIQGDDEFPNIDEINLKITKVGEKLKTEYTVMPTPNKSPLPADLIGEIDLELLVEPTPLKTVYEILGEEYDSDDDDSDDDSVTTDVDDLPEEDEEETEVETGEDDGLSELTRAQLKKVIAEEELDIQVYKSWTDDQIREAIREARPVVSEDEDEPVEEDEDEPVEEDDDDDDEVLAEEDDDDLADIDSLDDVDEEPEPPKKGKKGKK